RLFPRIGVKSGLLTNQAFFREKTLCFGGFWSSASKILMGDKPMMTRVSNTQSRLFVVNWEELIPKDHLLRKINEAVDFRFIYDKVEHLYSPIGRPSIDPVILFKMTLIGYLYGVPSERRLEEEVKLNLAYRWFVGLQLDDPVPDHSTFSQNRRRSEERRVGKEW